MDGFNYTECLKKVDLLFLELERASYKYPQMELPNLVSNYDVHYEQKSLPNKNTTLNYVIKKIETEEEFLKLYAQLGQIYKELCLEEKEYFVNCLLHRTLTDEGFAEKMNISSMAMRKIKKSVVLKITEGLKISVMKVR